MIASCGHSEQQVLLDHTNNKPFCVACHTLKRQMENPDTSIGTAARRFEFVNSDVATAFARFWNQQSSVIATYDGDRVDIEGAIHPSTVANFRSYARWFNLGAQHAAEIAGGKE